MKISRFALAFGSVAVIGIAAACSSSSSGDDDLGNEPDGGGTDAMKDQNTPVDAGSDAAACDLTKPFAAATPIPGVNTADGETGPHLTADELTIYFESDQSDHGASAGDEMIYVATRPDRNSAFSGVALIPGGAVPGYASAPMPSADQLKLYFTITEGMSGDDTIKMVSRTSTALNFGSLTTVAGVDSTSSSQSSPFLSADGQQFWFSAGASNGTEHIYSATGAFSTPTVVTELNSSASESNPYLSADGFTIFFTSNRTGGLNELDIWTATRTSNTGTFSTPVNEQELNTTSNDILGSLSQDGCRIYFASDRPGGTAVGTYDMYVAERPQ